ncbi:DNA-directed RNA polymerase [Filobasidium floriforme]|uniref:DNA-directed RNA polymerase n=1 Tax=Filobasidium floriforme TaxID=5210 RepID=UPI001E8E8FBA|nr:DNA-directed RNA polymerase [Filobasidium floriforme]KAH8080847.1 DNA-directed RNA polymerase [Filobasidium floriforme]
MAQEVDFNEPVITTSDGLDKITIIHNTPNYDMVTFCLHEEDHTLGNVLRWMCMKDDDVEFCGYSAPHPSEPKIHLRIQMHAVTCLMTALSNLKDLYKTIDTKYAADLKHGDFTTEEDYDVSANVDEIVSDARERFEDRKRAQQQAQLESQGAGAGGEDVEMA